MKEDIFDILRDLVGAARQEPTAEINYNYFYNCVVDVVVAEVKLTITKCLNCEGDLVIKHLNQKYCKRCSNTRRRLAVRRSKLKHGYYKRQAKEVK